MVRAERYGFDAEYPPVRQPDFFNVALVGKCQAQK
jgi:hypothetical protein